MSDARVHGTRARARADGTESALLWVLNFDADEELGSPRAYTPRDAVRARFDALASRVGPLLAEGDVLLADHREALGAGVRAQAGAAQGASAAQHAGAGAKRAHAAAGMEGRAFCPTPRALATLAAAGATLPPAPPVEVLRRVNDRAFHASLGLGLPGAAFVDSLEAALTVLASPSCTGAWLAKRAFGFAGRGRRRFAAGAIDEPGRAWLARALTLGGLEMTPLCERLADFALHGFVATAGEVTLGEPTVQVIDPAGAWQATRRAAAAELAMAEAEDLVREARSTAIALREAGYFGPFGIDAFRWRAPGGEPRFHPRCDINARYTMGWAWGMGDARPDRLRAVT